MIDMLNVMFEEMGMSDSFGRFVPFTEDELETLIRLDELNGRLDTLNTYVWFEGKSWTKDDASNYINKELGIINFDTYERLVKKFKKSKIRG